MSEFKPAWWLSNKHLQTLWPALLRRCKSLALLRERIELADGDFIDLDWMPRQRGPIVLILHGLEGSANSTYALGMLQAMDQKGWRSVVMHFRGCSGEANRLARTYHSGDTVDIATIIKILMAREPGVAIAVVGFSLGGNVLLKWLGETGAQNPLTAAVAISVPFNLSDSVDFMQQGFSRVYDRHLLKCLKAKVVRKSPAEKKSLVALKNIREYDEKFTAPLHGFPSAADYYNKSSCRQFLSSIQVPTLILHAADDPFVPMSAIPQPSELASNTRLEVSAGGGHVGFISGNVPWRARYWLDERVPEFLQEYF